jgi:hypothetical protein
LADRFVQQRLRRHHVVDYAHLLGLCRTQVAARQQQIKTGLDTYQPWQTLGTAGSRQQAELDLRQAQHGRRGIGRDATIAGHRQFQAAAETGAVYRRYHRHVQFRQARETRLCRLRQGLDLAGRLHPADHADIGARQERLRLVGNQHHAGHLRIALDRFECGAEGVPELGVHRVLGGAGHAEAQDDDAILAFFELE